VGSYYKLFVDRIEMFQTTHPQIDKKILQTNKDARFSLKGDWRKMHHDFLLNTYSLSETAAKFTLLPTKLHERQYAPH
jgi:hypothetical protein